MFGALTSFVITSIFFTLGGMVGAESLSNETRDLAFDSYKNLFYISNNGKAFFKESSENDGRNPNFWQNAEMIEIAEDSYDRSEDPEVAGIVGALCFGFVDHFGTDWSYNKYNDDLIWAVIAFARAEMITGNEFFGKIGAKNFQIVWDRGWDSALGGGLWWTTDRTSKNACVNGPGAIAATLFYRMNYGMNYLNQAIQIYTWLRSHLFHSSDGKVEHSKLGKVEHSQLGKLDDPQLGKVDDHVDANGALNGWTFTYNQGTFAGAAALLHQTVGGSTYASDGRLAILWAKNNLTGEHVPGILNDEYKTGDGLNDGAGFKGIFARWASKWIAVTGETEFNSWMQQNANAAWTYRNIMGVTWGQWWHRTSDTSVTSWECSDAISILQNSP